MVLGVPFHLDFHYAGKPAYFDVSLYRSSLVGFFTLPIKLLPPRGYSCTKRGKADESSHEAAARHSQCRLLEVYFCLSFGG